MRVVWVEVELEGFGASPSKLEPVPAYFWMLIKGVLVSQPQRFKNQAE